MCQDPSCKNRDCVVLSQDGLTLRFCNACAAAWLEIREKAPAKITAIAARIRQASK